LSQVIANLLSNAAKFTQPGGRIVLSLARENSEAVLRVRDNGAGMASDEVDRIFKMFVQLGPPQEGGSSGLGVGLSIVKTLAELHGGRVEAHSDGPGAGSEFVVRLPALPSEAAEPAPQPGATAGASRGPYRILVADDNEDAATVLATALRGDGHDVRVAHDGSTALESAGAFHPELAILDIGMPGPDGYDVARQLRSVFGDGIVLIALTGWSQLEDRQLAREAGFDHHLTKPVELASIERVLGSMS
jgi:CheY-like chemotaxis protein